MRHYRLLLTCLLLAAPACYAQSTNESASPVQHGEKINVVYRPVSEAEAFRPTTGKPGTWPGVILISDSDGLDDFLRRRALELTQAGFQVVAMNPHLELPSDIPGDNAHERALRDIGGAIAYLSQWTTDPANIGIVGYGTGGSLAFDFAMSQPGARAIVANYAVLPAGDPMLPHLHAALMINQAEHDSATSEEAADLFLQAAATSHLHPAFKKYPGTAHGFDREDSPNYNATAASDAELRTRTFLKKRLVPHSPPSTQPPQSSPRIGRA